MCELANVEWAGHFPLSEPKAVSGEHIVGDDSLEERKAASILNWSMSLATDDKLAPSSQTKVDQLLAENSQRQLLGEEAKEFDQWLVHIEQLTILKTRA